MLFAAWAVVCSDAQTLVTPRTQLDSLRPGETLNELQAQNTPTVLVLSVGKPIQSQIKGDETQVLKLTLQRDQYVQVAFEWQNLDLDVQVLEPSGGQLAGSDGHVRGSGSLPVAFVAGEDGDYQLVVRAVEKVRIEGSYSVTLESARRPTADDLQRVKAAKLLIEGQKESTLQGESRDIAFHKLTQALEIWNDIGDTRAAAYTSQALGSLLLAAKPSSSSANPTGSTRADADTFYGQAIEIVRNRNQRQFGYTLLEIGSDYQRFTSPQEALPLFEQALQVLQDNGDQSGEWAALFSMGIAYARIGTSKSPEVPDNSESALNEALKKYDAALNIARALHDRLSEARTLNAIGGAYGVLAKQDQALSHYLLAAPIFRELNDRYREAITINNIAVTSDDLGDWQTAKDKYLEAISAYQSLLSNNDPRSCLDRPAARDIRLCGSIANTLDNVGELYNSLGDAETALATLQDSLLIREALRDSRGTGATLSRIAYAYLLENKPNEALKKCDEALPLSLKSGDLRKVFSIRTFKGMAYQALNDPDQALSNYQEALIDKTDDRRAFGITLNQIGRAYAAKKEFTRAFENYQQSLTIWQDIKDQEWETRTLYDLAKAEDDRKNIAQSHEYIERALQIIESRRVRLSSQKLRVAFFANQEDIYKLDIDLKMRLGELLGATKYVAAAFETGERSRARLLGDLLKELTVAHNSSFGLERNVDAKLDQLVAQKQLVERQLNVTGKFLLSGNRSKSETDGNTRDLNRLEEEYDGLDARIRSLNPSYAELTKPSLLSSQQIQAQLDTRTVLLEYSLGDQRSYVWAVTPNTIEAFQLAPREVIEAAANRIVKSLADRNRTVNGEAAAQWERRREQADQDFNAASAALSDLVIRQVAPLLGNKRLVIVADGALQRVSFAALLLPREGTQPQRRLIEDHEIICEPSASVLALHRAELAHRKSASRAVAILADPVFDKDDSRVPSMSRRVNPPANASSSNGAAPPVISTPARDLSRALEDIGIDHFPRLFSSASEARAIIALSPAGEVKRALDFDANRETATSSELSNYRVVHFATHAVVNYEHPELSGIVLSLVDRKGQPQDGYLRLHDIYNLNLTADLIVLSACQTGVGQEIKGEGLMALTRGFMYAGAARVVASMWRVDDRATSELMAEFYKQMFTYGQTPGAALRAAQRKLSQQQRWSSPYYWAGFVLQGEWN